MKTHLETDASFSISPTTQLEQSYFEWLSREKNELFCHPDGIIVRRVSESKNARPVKRSTGVKHK